MRTAPKFYRRRDIRLLAAICRTNRRPGGIFQLIEQLQSVTDYRGAVAR